MFIDELCLLNISFHHCFTLYSQMKKEMLWKRQKASSRQDLQLSRSVEYYKTVCLRFVGFKCHLPLPNRNQPFLWGKNFKFSNKFLCLYTISTWVFRNLLGNLLLLLLLLWPPTQATKKKRYRHHT